MNCLMEIFLPIAKLSRQTHFHMSHKEGGFCPSEMDNGWSPDAPMLYEMCSCRQASNRLMPKIEVVFTLQKRETHYKIKSIEKSRSFIGNQLPKLKSTTPKSR